MRLLIKKAHPTKREFSQRKALSLMVEGVETTNIALADKILPMLLKMYQTGAGMDSNPERVRHRDPVLRARNLVFDAIRGLVASGQLVAVRHKNKVGIASTVLRLPGTTCDTPVGAYATLEAFQAAARHFYATEQFDKLGLKFRRG